MSMFDHDVRPVTGLVVLVGTRVSRSPYAIRDPLAQNRYPFEWADAITPSAELAPTLAEAAKARRLPETGATTGKVVLRP
jgi:hypothetical protein